MDIATRIDLLYEALGRVRAKTPPRIPLVKTQMADGSVSLRTDFSGGQSKQAMHLDCVALVDAIASLKDHLRIWCEENARQFHGDQLINNNRDVAIVHDLWNMNKHSKLNRKPRSGSHPRCQNFRRLLGISGGQEAMWIISTDGADMKQAKGTGEFVTTADVVDENGEDLGRLDEIAKRAVGAWSEVISAATGKPV